MASKVSQLFYLLSSQDQEQLGEFWCWHLLFAVRVWPQLSHPPRLRQLSLEPELQLELQHQVPEDFTSTTFIAFTSFIALGWIKDILKTCFVEASKSFVGRFQSWKDYWNLESFIVKRQIVKPSFIVALIASTILSYITKIIDSIALDQFSNLLLLLFRLQSISQKRHQWQAQMEQQRWRLELELPELLEQQLEQKLKKLGQIERPKVRP